MSDGPSRAPQPHLSDGDLVDLLNDLLDGPARARLLEHARRCTSCDARLREASAAHERARALAGEALREIPAATRGKRAHRAARPAPAWNRLLLAAAGLALVAGGAILLRPMLATRTPVAGAVHAWLPSGMQPSAMRRTTSAADSLVRAGIAAYERRDLAAAESLFQHPFEDETLEWVRRCYLANTLVALGRPDQAIPLIGSQQSDLLPEPWRGETQWTYLVALSQAGRPARADSVRRLLLARDDEIGDRARALEHAARDRR